MDILMLFKFSSYSFVTKNLFVTKWIANFVQWVLTQYYNYFYAPIAPNLARRSPFKVNSVSFWRVPNILLVFPCFLTQYVLILYFPHLSLELATSSRIPGSLAWKRVFKSHILNAGCAHCYWGVTAPSLFCWKESGNTCRSYPNHFHIHLVTPFIISISIYWSIYSSIIYLSIYYFSINLSTYLPTCHRPWVHMNTPKSSPT